MIDLLEELLAKLFGAPKAQPIRVRADDKSPNGKIMKGQE